MKPSFIRKQYNAFEDEVILQKKIGPVYENKKRLSAIKLAYENGSNIAILDDGFQDYSLKKNLSIICFNEKQWIGNGLVIPSGPLREDISALKRADCVVINGKKNTSIEKTILDQNKNIKIYYSKYNPKNIDSFKNKKVVAFAGIGNPQNFFNLLKNYNLNPIKEIKFPDHYNYSSKDLEKLLSISKENDAILLTTEKDYFRIIEHYKKNINFIKIELEIENKDLFIEEIKKII
jgi:tetraacyldisaccharide 4'-kinase